MNDDTIIKIGAIAGITALAVCQLVFNHQDGIFMTTAAGIIGGIAGYTIKSAKTGGES